MATRIIDRHEIQRLTQHSAQLVEVLPEPEYDDHHLPGAINIPLPRLDREAPERLDKRAPVIVYCNDFL